ncbi:MAG: type II toxin-antitoxin system RelE/ParE family toxin [Vampirovibrionia bacterium]|jgi:mRNA-degrading endonuclease YafQ of YafQ-DinJ toxin-antitoxin module
MSKKEIKVLQTQHFAKCIKKLHANQKRELDAAIKLLIKNTDLGEEKIGDLQGIRVYKFMMINHLTLLAYSYDGSVLTLTLLAIGSHENFYRDLKKKI